MTQSLHTLRAAYEDPYAAARAHRAAGGKVVGYFLNSVPEELIVAAGLFPVRLRGSPSAPSPLAEHYMESYMDGEVRSIFGALLEGRFDFVDLIVIPRNAEMYLQLFYFLLEIPKWEPQVRLPPMHLFDLLQTPGSTTLRYVIDRLHAFADQLQSIGGHSINVDSLSIAIRDVNVKRILLQDASSLWQSPSPALDGIDALKTISASAFMSGPAYVDALSSLIGAPPPVRRSGPRIMIKGSPQSDTRFTELVERLGGSVVAHDHLWGDRTYARTVHERSNPWTAIARHYCYDIPSPREYPQSNADAHFIALVRRAHVDGVVFFHDEWDDTLGWEYPDQKKLLDAHNIPSAFLKRQRYFDPDEAEQARALSALFDQLRQPA